MLASATLIPDTALLVPGAAGRAIVLTLERAAAVAAVRAALDGAAAGAADAGRPPARVVVVAPGRTDAELAGPVRASLAGAGIDLATVGWSAPPATGGSVAGVAASVALLLIGHVGWTGPVRVVEVGPSDGADGPAGERTRALQDLGRDLVGGPERVVLLATGSLSARNGPGAPVRADERAASFDAAVLADLAAGDAAARDRLTAIPADLATELVATAWAPLQVLCGASSAVGAIEATVPWSAAPFGVTYPVAQWRAR